MVTRLRLLLLALVIGIAIIAAEGVLYSAITQRTWNLFRDLDPWRVGIVATPYVVLALLRVRRLLPWAVALVLTLSLWGYWLYSTVSFSLHPDGSGVDMGGALLLLASPLVISAVAVAIHFAQQDARADIQSSSSS